NNRDPAEHGYEFAAGELRVGGRVHKGLTVSASPLTRYAAVVKDRPEAKAARAADPKACVYSICLDVDRPGLRGPGLSGRIVQYAGITDDGSAVLFADRPADAPIIHFGGPLQVALANRDLKLHLGRDNDIRLVVGTPGRGHASFANLGYDETIP